MFWLWLWLFILNRLTVWYDHGILWIPLYKEEQYSEKKMGLKDPWPYHKRWYNEKLRENDEDVTEYFVIDDRLLAYTVLKKNVRRTVCLWIPFNLSYTRRRKRWFSNIIVCSEYRKRWITLYRRHAITKSCHALFYSVKFPWLFVTVNLCDH